MIVGMGIDVAEVKRIGAVIESQKERFLRRVYTREEVAYCEQFKNKYERYAGRFAVKEAAMKALGNRLEPRRTLGGCGSGAATRRTANAGAEGRGKENCGCPRGEKYRREHHAHRGAGLRAGDLRRVRVSHNGQAVLLCHAEEPIRTGAEGAQQMNRAQHWSRDPLRQGRNLWSPRKKRGFRLTGD